MPSFSLLTSAFSLQPLVMKSPEKLIQALLPELVAFRRDIHRRPEPGYAEYRTSGKVAERLTETGKFQITAGIAQTGLIATLCADKPGRCVAFRADMDCLPIAEKPGKPYISQNPGYMHACGHDGHTTCLLGAALLLAQLEDRLHGPVKFIFQPAEEEGAGGKAMTEAGALMDPEVDMIFGLHGWPKLELGAIACRSGPITANADRFDIQVRGRGGHAAFPHDSVDPIPISSRIVTALQSLTSPTLSGTDRTVVTVTRISAGTAYNIIPDTVTLSGTIRTLTRKSQRMAFDRIESLAVETAQSMRGTAQVEIHRGYPALVNHPEAVQYLVDTLAQSTEFEPVLQPMEPTMAGEDFAYFAQKKPACFFALGLTPKGECDPPLLHQAHFDFNDDALPIGALSFAELALNFWK